MTTLGHTQNDRLVAIYDMIYSQEATFQNFMDKHNQNPVRAKNDIIKEIRRGLKNAKYDGPMNNSDAIFWFCKGLKSRTENPPENTVNNFTAHDDENEWSNILKLLQNRKQFARDDYDVKRQQLQSRVSFRNFIGNSNNAFQVSMVDRIMYKLDLSPTEWQIDFDQLTDEGRELLLPRLKKFLEDNLYNYPIINDYKLQFDVGGIWYSKPLTPENWNALIDSLSHDNFIFNYQNNKPPEYFYEEGSMEFPEWSLFSSIRFTKIRSNGGNNERGGSFFKFLIKPEVPNVIKNYLVKLQMFETLVNEKGKQREELSDCCFIYALKQTGCYDEDTLNQIRMRIQNRYLSQKNINLICEEFKIQIKLTYIDENASSGHEKRAVSTMKNKKTKNYLGVDDPLPNRTHHFNVFQKHYFIEEKTPISTYYFKNWKTINDETKFNKEFKNRTTRNSFWQPSKTMISSSNLVRGLLKENSFIPITYGQYSILNTIFYNEIDNDISHLDLTFNEDFCTKLIQPKQFKSTKNEKKDDPTYWYADFEADTSGECHKPFMVVVQSKNGKINEEFRGENCAVKLLNFLPNEAVVYFHNLAYDIRFLAGYGIRKAIIKGTKTMTTDIAYQGKVLHFKDSLPILSCKLSQMPQMFDIPNIQKEIFPYKYYTFENLKRNYGEISKAGENEDKPWTQEDYKLFNSNIDKIQGCRIDENHFDLWKYCSFYCRQDVNILRLGFNQFREGFILDFGIDPYKFISISSLANEVFNQRVYYNRDLFQIGGVVRKFCSHAVYGGRCMTAFNKKWHVKKNLCDFDAVSLYPSAMSRLYTVKGKPVVIEPENLNLTFLSKQGAYIVEIKINKINKHFAFPLIVKKTKEGNKNEDHLQEGETLKMVVDNITLEDLIEFQQIEFEIIRGYYWPGERDYTIQKEIKKIFEKRVEYKKQKNPLQQLYKLIMNSCYGKTIERPIEKDFKYLKEGEELDRFWRKNYNKIVEDVKLNNSEKSIHAVKTLSPIDKHFNFTLLGCQVLSMSKRIMNEVMCLAFDLGCHIYYQDTDSFMIEKEDLPKLEEAFKNKYKRNLIGSNLGEFHCDFPNIKDHDEMPWSVEAFFLMKKMYIHKITDETKDVDYVVRGKGLTLNSIKYLAKEKFDNNLMKLYETLYNGTTETFDLTKGQPCFQLKKNMSITTLNEFKRRIHTNYEEGEIEKYFKYAE